MGHGCAYATAFWLDTLRNVSSNCTLRCTLRIVQPTLVVAREMQFDKRQLYETDIRVPYFVRCPGCTAGVELDEPVSHVMPQLSDLKSCFGALRKCFCLV